MKFKIINMLIILLFNFSLARNISAKVNNKYLKFEKEIKLFVEQDKYFGEVTKLDVNGSYFLITDKIGKTFALFNKKTGKLFHRINLQECDPGAKNKPINAQFYSNNEILALNSIPWGFHLDQNGNCKKLLDKEFSSPSLITMGSNNKIIGFFNEYNPFLTIMEENGKTINKKEVTDIGFKNFIYRFLGGGVAIDLNMNIYLLLPYDNWVRKYNNKLELQGGFKIESSNFRRIEQDLSSNPQEVIKGFAKTLTGKTTVSSLYIDKELLIAEFMHDRKSNEKYEIVVCNLQGKRLNKDDIFMEMPISCIKNGKIYCVKKDRIINSSGDIPNPILQIFTINLGNK